MMDTSKAPDYVPTIEYVRLQSSLAATEAERDDYKKRLNPSFDYVDGQPVAVAEDEIDRLQAELSEARAKSSRLEARCWDLQDENVVLRRENERLRNALIDIKEELEYDISNGKVALDIAKAALREVTK